MDVSWPHIAIIKSTQVVRAPEKESIENRDRGDLFVHQLEMGRTVRIGPDFSAHLDSFGVGPVPNIDHGDFSV